MCFFFSFFFFLYICTRNSYCFFVCIKLCITVISIYNIVAFSRIQLNSSCFCFVSKPVFHLVGINQFTWKRGNHLFGTNFIRECTLPCALLKCQNSAEHVIQPKLTGEWVRWTVFNGSIQRSYQVVYQVYCWVYWNCP